jgi:hypothetical protein
VHLKPRDGFARQLQDHLLRDSEQSRRPWKTSLQRLRNMNAAGIDSGPSEHQALHIPEHLLQEAATASHGTSTPRSVGIFDYISRAANSAATILQVR